MFLVHLFITCLFFSSNGAQETCLEDFPETDELVRARLLTKITSNCSYNRNETPNKEGHVRVFARVYLYHLRTSSKDNLPRKFSAQLLLQLRWLDRRLGYDDSRVQALIGEAPFMDKIWIPHISLSRERSLVMGHLRKDTLFTIFPSGDVLYTSRLKTSIICSLDIKKFPFDTKVCRLFINRSSEYPMDYTLEWEKSRPVSLRKDSISLSEFYLINLEANSIPESGNLTLDSEQGGECRADGDGCLNDHLVLRFTLGRDYGFYLMDYYVPSILLVILSWMTFWITADQVPPRVLLGTSTLLTFILLGWTDSSLPTLSNFKANDIWAIGCTSFIFLSLVEFAFVNTIDRREPSQKVEVKKATSKYILKSTLSSPRPRKLRRSSSCPSSPEIRKHFAKHGASVIGPRHRTLQEVSGRELVRGVRAALKDEKTKPASFRFLPASPEASPPRTRRRKSMVEAMEAMISMTPQEVAMWIDVKSRFVFPLAFLIFNICYWSFLWI